MALRELDLSVDRGVAWLTLNRPHKRNALTHDMWHALIDDLNQLARDPGTRAMAIRGKGSAFCAGGDLGSVKDATGREDRVYRALAENGLSAIHEFPKPTLALVDGPCVGAGCSIALACDVRFATPAASFAVPAVGYGLIFEDAGLDRLVELTGSGQAMRILLAGLPLSGEQALSLGLVEVCATDAERQALDYLTAVTAGDPATVEQTRTAIRRAGRGPRRAFDLFTATPTPEIGPRS